MRVLIVEDDAELALRMAPGCATTISSPIRRPMSRRRWTGPIPRGWRPSSSISGRRGKAASASCAVHPAGRILAQSDILDQLYPLDRERDANTVEIYVGRLRRKIGRATITTVRGLGYRFER